MGECPDDAGFDTKCLHGGWGSDPATNAKGVPVYRFAICPARPRHFAGAHFVAAALPSAAGAARNAHVAVFPRRFARL